MSDHREDIPKEPMRKAGKEREFDILMFVLAGALAVTVLCAVGYGIMSSSRVATTTVPQVPPEASAPPTMPALPASASATDPGKAPTAQNTPDKNPAKIP